MWGWIKPLVEALLAFLDGKSKEPSTIQDANTPKTIRDRWNAYIVERMRDKGGGDKQPK